MGRQFPQTGASKGSNLSLVLVDQTMAHDGEGKPLIPYRGATLVVPVRKKGTDTAGPMVVWGLFEAEGVPGAYGVFMPARVVTERRQRVGAEGKGTVEESWEFQGADGHSLEIKLHYDHGVPQRGKSESRVYSGAHPDFFRIYRVELGSDVARSTATGVDRISRISVKAAGPTLAPLFDGTEQLVSLTSIPSYLRQVYLPGP